MRQVTWAAAFFLLGLAVVLATASLLEPHTVADRGPSSILAVHPKQEPAQHVRPAESRRQLASYRRSALATQE